MSSDVLRIVLVLCSGTVAGVFFAVAVSVMPALHVLPAGRYVEVHQLLGRGYHPIMPIIVSGAVLADGALAWFAERRVERMLYTAALLLLLAVQVISHLGNERVNRRVRTVAPEAIPPGWDDPRARWRAWHLVRTVLALLAFAVIGVAVVVPR